MNRTYLNLSRAVGFPARLFHTALEFRGSPLISTRLQPGVRVGQTRNRFSGFPPPWEKPLKRFYVRNLDNTRLHSSCENTRRTADSGRSNGVAADRSPRREPWVIRRCDASRGAAAEAHTKRCSGRDFCRPSGASRAVSLTPTAHAVGYSLPLLRSLASTSHAKSPERARSGVFTQSVKPGANERGPGFSKFETHFALTIAVR